MTIPTLYLLFGTPLHPHIQIWEWSGVANAFPSTWDDFLLRSLAVVLPALVSLEPVFSKASSKSDIVADTIFLAALQALASFSWGSGSSSSSSLMALPLPLLPFPRDPWPFPRPLALPFPRPSSTHKEMAVRAEELHELFFQVLILRLKLHTTLPFLLPGCVDCSVPILGIFVFKGTRSVGALSPDHFSRLEMHLQLFWGVPGEHFGDRFPSYQS